MTSTKLTKPHYKHFSEVIFATTDYVIAQVYKEALPDITLKESIFQGHCVKVISSYDNSHVTYGIITKINNSSLDNIHKPTALGLTLKELQELHPQLHELLRKELEIYLFAYRDSSGEIVNIAPLKPMMVHDFVYLVSEEEELLKITSDLNSLISLIKKNNLKVDILLNLIETGYKLRNLDHNYILNIGQELSRIYGDEAETLIQTLKKLSLIKDKNTMSKKNEKNNYRNY